MLIIHLNLIPFKISELNEHIKYYETHLACFESQLKELIIFRTN